MCQTLPASAQGQGDPSVSWSPSGPSFPAGNFRISAVWLSQEPAFPGWQSSAGPSFVLVTDLSSSRPLCSLGAHGPVGALRTSSVGGQLACQGRRPYLSNRTIADLLCPPQAGAKH